MEIKTFKIRLSYTVKVGDEYKTIYIDEVENFDKLYGIGFDWNWINVADGYSGKEKISKEKYYKLTHGFCDDDVMLYVSYITGFCYVNLISNEPLDKPVTVYDNYKKQLITRPLFDWVKISINGCLSDGVGENPVGYYWDRDNEVWLSEIITDEKLDKTGKYFFINEPIRVIDDPEELKKIEYPGYTKKRNEIIEKYTEYYDDNKTMLKRRDNSAIYDEHMLLNDKAVEYALNKIAELYDK